MKQYISGVNQHILNTFNWYVWLLNMKENTGQICRTSLKINHLIISNTISHNTLIQIT